GRGHGYLAQIEADEEFAQLEHDRRHTAARPDILPGDIGLGHETENHGEQQGENAQGHQNIQALQHPFPGGHEAAHPAPERRQQGADQQRNEQQERQRQHQAQGQQAGAQQIPNCFSCTGTSQMRSSALWSSANTVVAPTSSTPALMRPAAAPWSDSSAPLRITPSMAAAPFSPTMPPI